MSLRYPAGPVPARGSVHSSLPTCSLQTVSSPSPMTCPNTAMEKNLHTRVVVCPVSLRARRSEKNISPTSPPPPDSSAAGTLAPVGDLIHSPGGFLHGFRVEPGPLEPRWHGIPFQMGGMGGIRPQTSPLRPAVPACPAGRTGSAAGIPVETKGLMRVFFVPVYKDMGRLRPSEDGIFYVFSGESPFAEFPGPGMDGRCMLWDPGPFLPHQDLWEMPRIAGENSRSCEPGTRNPPASRLSSGNKGVFGVFSAQPI